MARILLIFIFSGFTLLSAKTHEISMNFHTGVQPRYGADYHSLNLPRGIYGLNATSASVTGENFKEPAGISFELLFHYNFLNHFFAETGGHYVYGLETSGKFPLRDPSTHAIYKMGGTTEIPSKGSAKLSHFGFPLTVGFFIAFWDELKVFAGIGGAFQIASFKSGIETADGSILNFQNTTEVAPKFFTYHLKFMAEYNLIGGAEDPTVLSVNAGIYIINGMSPATSDTKADTVPAAAPVFPLLGTDSVKVDLSGYRIFMGVTYYFFRS